MSVIVKEEPLTEALLQKLIDLSIIWENENNVYGYHSNQREDIINHRIFIAYQQDEIVGYSFGHSYDIDKKTALFQPGEHLFEVDELYVVKNYRSQGIGKMLLEKVVENVQSEHDYLTLSTATKNHRAILHFYIDEVGMNFHCAHLFKKL